MFRTQTLEDRIDAEFAKLGSKNVTILAASGDGGSHFSFGPFTSGSIASDLNAIICEKMHMPVYPASSQWVLAVGGTQWVADSMYAPACSPTTPCAWTQTGCGFANKDLDEENTVRLSTVKKYLNSAESEFKSVFSKAGTFNPKGRPYPDVSLLAQFGIPLCTYGGCSGCGGTSAAAPAMGGLISLINDDRLNNDMAPLGHVNTKMYELMQDASAYAECFNDIYVEDVDPLWDVSSYSSS